MNKILISACLLNHNVRYDGVVINFSESILDHWIANNQMVPICPEVEGGLSTPRAPAEISSGDGTNVWSGGGAIITTTGKDVTEPFKKGAQLALDLCKKYRITVAILTESSPSCGSTNVYDGSFSGTKKMGVGTTTALLEKNGILVFNQHQFKKAADALMVINRRS